MTSHNSGRKSTPPYLHHHHIHHYPPVIFNIVMENAHRKFVSFPSENGGSFQFANCSHHQGVDLHHHPGTLRTCFFIQTEVHVTAHRVGVVLALWTWCFVAPRRRGWDGSFFQGKTLRKHGCYMIFSSTLWISSHMHLKHIRSECVSSSLGRFKKKLDFDLVSLTQSTPCQNPI